jgi:putative membrane protein
MTSILPYCGAPPIPSTLAGRFNLDPWLIAALVALAGLHLLRLRPGHRLAPMTGWIVAAAALLSPLCALSVALFSARVAQHMVLVLVAAPLVAHGLPARIARPWPAGILFFLSLWFWHMPTPNAAPFASPIG